MGVEAIGNIFRIPDLRRRVFFTLGMLVVLQFGIHIPTPGVDGFVVKSFMQQQGGNPLFGLASMFTGGAFDQLSIFSLGVMPYITASIILQLLTVVIPALEKLSKEGQVGRKKIDEYTRYLTVGITMIQASMLSRWILTQTGMGGRPLVAHPGFSLFGIEGVGFTLMTAMAMTTGTIFIMYMGEQITEKGIGNGISLIIFANIISGLPGVLAQALAYVAQETNQMTPFKLLMLFVMFVIVTAGVVILTQATRRIAIKTGRQVVGRRQAASRMSYLPIRINTAGVIPIIFASSILVFPTLFFPLLEAAFSEENETALYIIDIMKANLTYGTVFYVLMYSILIVFFCYFYTAIMFNPRDTADNLKKFGSAIPGYSPGKKTEERIDYILTRITAAGAIFLVVVAIIPELVSMSMGIPLNIAQFLGGTSLIIIVGVALDTVSQLENHMRVRNYDTFLKGGKRIRGRRR